MVEGQAVRVEPDGMLSLGFSPASGSSRSQCVACDGTGQS